MKYFHGIAFKNSLMVQRWRDEHAEKVMCRDFLPSIQRDIVLVNSLVKCALVALFVGAPLAGHAQKSESAATKEPFDWHGWWFLYHPGVGGKLVLDKFTVAMVIEDDALGLKAPVTGAWEGCIWTEVSAYAIKGNVVKLIFDPPGTKKYTFQMTSTGSDEADGVYLDDPSRHYVVKRLRVHDKCAGYSL